MSTRQSVKYEFDAGRQIGFHLFTDCMDRNRENIFLELNGVIFESSFDGDKGSVLVTIPWAWAVKLGLVTA
jgi:hypothetical protein